ncbi:Predicted Fe2+/Mn2+ transporter, VIT1/CCC1 family [Actinacidiphila yanglinensis]|uniref:Predicted Fe2+/Mn2+ transporter, VIT1/CCC1 family n=1 Tax=Actinacidiphila yanglinensis TaxID=310779 RepID=A0A1H5ZEX7_9ACTN|nr:VIT family protein [Actinacidiphila yanglinensis]SEG34275.1 Predicted Fe2+/Mn2+ transporter, VIT1/CCC1 family [Actinacidiphila yanglinensis]
MNDDRAGGSEQPDAPDLPERSGEHPDEPHHNNLGPRLNWLRAAVLGANDGVVSTAGIVVGVAGATDSRSALLTAGLAGLLAGSLSMAAGEYVSVSTQRDSEQAALAVEREELAATPQAELAELTDLLEKRGITHELAREVAEQLTARDALGAHARVELGIDPDQLANPWHAAWASFVSFTAGALLPLLAIVLPPHGWRLAVTVVSVLVALVACGTISARLGNAPVRPAVLRNAAGGIIAMAVTYAVGTLLGAAGI